MGLLSVGALLALWQLASQWVAQDLILPSPPRVARELLLLLPTREFRLALGATLLRGIEAFGLSLGLGISAGFAAGRFPAIAALLAPFLTVIKATPVLALILLTLLWFPSTFVPVFAALLMAFPVMTGSAKAGFEASSKELLEMAGLFRVPNHRVLLGLRIPAALPHLLSGAKSALGLSWKVVVAGEVLAQPQAAIGSGMQASRVLLETPRVFAWALSAILLCGLSEWLFGLLSGGGEGHVV